MRKKETETPKHYNDSMRRKRIKGYNGKGQNAWESFHTDTVTPIGEPCLSRKGNPALFPDTLSLAFFLFDFFIIIIMQCKNIYLYNIIIF